MECVNCDDGKTIVVDSIKYGGTVLRRRKCTLCGYLMWTEELEVYDKQSVRDAIAYKQQKYRDKKENKG